MDKLYTFVMDFRGGTFVRQVYAPSPRRAASQWARELGAEIEGMSDDARAELVAEVDEEEPTPIDGTTSVWHVLATTQDGDAFINIVETAS